MKKYIFIILAVILPFYMTAQSYNVGNFSGSFDISPIGSATYTIPIEIPPGTAGLQPSVGITFNSMAGDGIMGKGFSLTGSSCISRSANTLFHNGYIKDISFNSSDQYTLDGSRLIYYGNSEYRTEINPVSRIKIFSPNTSSTYFEMETKDGLKMEYGKTIDSKLFEQGNSSKQVAIWMLNKVIDQQGNYYTYTYEKVDANGEMRIKQIDYTGSINSNPYCSIRFTYTTRFYDVNLTYISGTKTKESKILSSIEVYYNSSLFRRYTMQYSNDSSSDYIYLLSQITVSGQNNESLKPITFNWYKNSNFKQDQVIYDQSYYAKTYVNKADITLGDFNGDRKIDMLLTGWNGTQWGDWQTHLSTGLDFERFFFPKKFDTYSKAIFVCDLNGDGADDFFAVDKSSGSMTVMNYYLSINNGLDFKGYSGTGVYALNSWNFYPINSRGDGRMGFLVTSAPYSWTGYQLYMPVKDYTNLLKSTTDSYGNTTTITYKPMTDASVYTKNDITGGSAAVSGYDCLSFTAPFKLVSEISSSNGVGSTNSVTYKYENAKVFKRGRGFLGFSKMTGTDQRTAIQTVVTNEFSSTYYQPAIKSVVKMYSYTNKKLAQTDYVNTLMQSSGSIFYLPASTSESSYEPSASSLIKSANTAYTYDSYSNILTQTTTFGSGETNKITNTYNNNTSNWLIGQLTNCETKVTANGKTQTSSCEYLYDGGLLKSKTSNPTSTNKIKTTYTYDTYGNISMQKTEANNEARTETFTYNSGRFIASHTNHLNQKTSFVYEPASGLVTSKTDPDGITYSYTYDGFGNIKNESNSLGRSVATSWAWANGDPTYSIIKKQESFNNGQVVNTWFDSFGRELQSNHKDFSNKLVYTKNIYNELGQITSTSEPYFSNSTPAFQTNQYDTYGRLSQQTTLLGTITYTYSGNTTTINDGTKGYTSTRITDLSGKTTSVTDSGGETITYTYGPTGDPDKITCGNAVYTMKYDEVGRQTELNDPNIGVTTYTYNGWGDLLEQTTPGGKTEKYIYASDGKIMSYQRGSEVFSYTYDTKYIDRVKSTKCGNIETSFTYGNYGKITSKTKTVDNKSFTFAYNYNSQDQLASMTYPNSKTIAYNYVNGELTQITWQANNSIVWQKTDANAKGQNLTINLGNGIQESFLYNNQGIPTSIKAAKSGNTLLNIAYSQIDSRGNIGKREDLIKGQTELFTFDSMNRLSTGMQYANNGNILSKSGITNYQYKSGRPHAVTQVDIPSATNLQSVGLSITYNSINRPQELSVGTTEKYTLTYAPGKERIKSVYTKNNAVVQTKYYVGPYEEIAKGATIQKNYYIYVAGEIAAVYTEGTSDAGMYYFHKDHQGSPWLITNSSGSEVQRLNFDIWGRRRDPNNWNSFSNLATPKFDRGYTGHEHLDMFELINMNARLYDPVIGRFLSPDPQVQLTDASQAYNRYSYAMNNPVSFKDPNGECFFLIAAIIGGWIGMGTAMITSEKSGWGLAGDMFKGFGIGAASGAAGALVGGAIAGVISPMGALGSFSGSISGISGGFAGGFVGTAGNAWANGANFVDGLKSGVISGGIGAAGGLITGGITDIRNYNRQIGAFRRGCEALDIETGDPVDATDAMLNKAQNAWYSDAPMDKVKKFTVENVPANYQNGLDENNAYARTVPLRTKGTELLTGYSNVYFNKNTAFTSAKRLFYTMGHEFVHVSQYGAMVGKAASLVRGELFTELMEFHAYSYESVLGGKSLNSFDRSALKAIQMEYPQYWEKLNWNKFKWTNNHSYKYPF